MPYLGDYIGYLLSEITNARAQADYESVRLAEFYASDPYLKHLPVPRFRMPTVTLDVPVVIQNIEDVQKGGYTNDRMLSYMQSKLDRILSSSMKKCEIPNLTFDEKKTLTQSVSSTFDEFKQLDSSPIRITHLADKVVTKVAQTLKKSPSISQDHYSRIQGLSDDIRQMMYSEFSKYLRKTPRLSVLVNTAEVKESGSPDTIARIQISLTEQGFEWDVVDDPEKDVQNRRLIPE